MNGWITGIFIFIGLPSQWQRAIGNCFAPLLIVIILLFVFGALSWFVELKSLQILNKIVHNRMVINTGTFVLGVSWICCNMSGATLAPDSVRTLFLEYSGDLTHSSFRHASRNNHSMNYLEAVIGDYLLQKAKKAKTQIEATISKYPSPLAEWSGVVFLGRRNFSSANFVEFYLFFGIVHLLVISGQHISLIASVCSVLMRLPLHLLYVFRKVRVDRWVYLDGAVTVFIGFFIIFYLSMIEFQTACQRAVIMYWTGRVWPLFAGRDLIWRQMKVAFVMQSVLFPLDILSLSSMMSWGAYIIFVASVRNRDLCVPLKYRLAGRLETQAMLSLFSWNLIGKISIFCFIGNIVLTPFFRLLLQSMIVIIVLDMLAGCHVIVMPLIGLENHILQSMFDTVQTLGEQIFPEWRIEVGSQLARTTLTVISCAMIITSLKNLASSNKKMAHP